MKRAISPPIVIAPPTLTWNRDGSFDLDGDLRGDVTVLDTGMDDTENRRGRHRLVFP